jgi:hypothetical protein
VGCETGFGKRLESAEHLCFTRVHVRGGGSQTGGRVENTLQLAAGLVVTQQMAPALWLSGGCVQGFGEGSVVTDVCNGRGMTPAAG